MIHQLHHFLRHKALQLLRRSLHDNYTYHSIAHTLEVCKRSKAIAARLRLDQHSIELLHTAAMYHDIGFTEHHLMHEQIGAEIFMKAASESGLPAGDTKAVVKLILATNPASVPADLLEMVIKDADLYYLSTNDYSRQAALLREELEWLYGEMTDDKWEEIQINFLRAHRFFTPGLANQLNEKKRSILAEACIAV
jgi:uncharacterized protein